MVTNIEEDVMVIKETIGLITENYVNFGITLIVGAVFFFLTYILLKKDTSSVDKERLKRATDAILETIEDSFVNDYEISIEEIYRLIYATGREYSIELDDHVHPLELLEDIELRFHRSRHLNYDQKKKYIGYVNSLVKKIDEATEKSDVPKPISELFDSIETSIEKNDMKGALDNLKILSKSYSGREISREHYYESRSDVLFPIMVATLAMLISFFGFMEQFRIEVLSFSSVLILYLITGTLMAVMFQYLKTQKSLRELKKDKELEPDDA
jgi:hypothetical protein